MTEIKLTNGRVRELRGEDLPKLIRICQDKEIKQFYFVEEIESMESYWQRILESQREIRNQPRGIIRQKYELTIEEREEVKGLLTIGIEPYTYWVSNKTGPSKHGIIFSYFIGEEFRRHGLATEVLKLAVPFAFEKLDAGTVCGGCLKENDSSQNLLEKVGLVRKWEGIAESGVAKGRDTIVYGLTIKEFYEQREKFGANFFQLSYRL